jgi:hypothetical protein
VRRLAEQVDALRLVEAVTRLHPDPFRSISRDAFEREAERAAAAETAGTRAEAVCALMRLGALLGERNGHTGIHALGEHAEPLHFYPVQPYEFDDGFFVVSAANPEHVGAEILSIGDIPIASVATQVEALVPADNHSTIVARRPSYLVAAEVLTGSCGGEASGKSFLLRPPLGDPFEVVLDPIPAARYSAALDADRRGRLPARPGARYLERKDEPAWVDRVPGSAAIVIGYNATGEASALAAEIARLAREKPPPVLVLDLRHNGGGDNTAYRPLLSELEGQARTTELVVLTSRITFSAAMQLVVDLETRTRATFVGEATGASPNHFGDAERVELPATGLLAHVATISWETAGPDDRRLTHEPDIDVPLRSEDFFEGRDRVLEAALDAVGARS